MSKYQEPTIEVSAPVESADKPSEPLAREVAVQVTASTEEADEPPVYLHIKQLAYDADNVRRRGKTSVTGLKALIMSQSLLQNLIVCPQVNSRGKATGKYGVIAGGRRLRALLELVAEGALPRDYQVLCRIVPRERAIAISAAENSEREPMSVADTIVAFADMVASGAGIEEIAVAFGITPLTVQRRARLANVSPRLFEMFSEDKITLDQLMALALTEDHARQEQVWDTTASWDRSASSLRRIILGEAVDAASDRLAKYVGLAAYEAAGGPVVRDLFTDADHGHIADVALLQRLANEKLAKKVAKVRKEGWAWVEVMIDRADVDAIAFLRAPTGRRAPTEQEATAIAAAQLALADAEKALQAAEASEDGDGEGLDALYNAVDDAERRIAALDEALQCVLPEVQALAGAVVGIDRHGKAQTHRGLIRAADRKTALALCDRATTPDKDAGDQSGDDDEECQPTATARLSDALCRKLTSHRTQALQVVLADNTQVALAALAHKLWLDLELRTMGQAQSALNVRATGCQGELTRSADDLEASRAHGELQVRLQRWAEVLPSESRALLDWLIEQPMQTLNELLAFCAAMTVSTVTSGQTVHAGDALARAVGLDMAQWWSPTVDSYLKQVTKAQIIEAVSAAVSPAAAAPLAKLKKGEAAARAEELLAGTRWLPGPLCAR